LDYRQQALELGLGVPPMKVVPFAKERIRAPIELAYTPFDGPAQQVCLDHPSLPARVTSFVIRHV